MNILRAEAYLARFANSERLSDIYDDDGMLQAALAVLFPGFEYPDFSHLTMAEIRKRYAANPQNLLPT
ncbi:MULTISPECIES: hypothetical protein [unclassified Variovorax]|uniref:hypothetical protein n=1 Tax=unclassified Variovorax TaxID=663243 RepID=UPI00076C2AE5|nr:MULTISPECIES: hypothetical protein [unclassified Variovorax]KWT98104.1 hypothetical protein APY03_0775 [Variovorax sp. WDL1]PNG50420.1 hypothetical protein CHC06_06044 [Variovorax sp. B2]PNG51293.1 hypothetical protein CHC07_05950 [Variovorax sp. B4]VTU43250.1 hypothetical protein SRS16P1_00476 [Variovorax sp. SRS16]VTU43273.1 hypothetical protein E5P1_00473 [Variovorax sp. PBL-E5]